MKLLMENWRHYLSEEKQTQLLEQYFNDDNLLTEEQELELLSEVEWMDMATDTVLAIKDLYLVLKDLIAGSADLAQTALEIPSEIASTAASGAEISTNVFKSVESIVGLLAMLILPGTGGLIALVVYRVLKLVFEYILKRKVLSLEEMKEKFKNPEAVEQLKGELTDALGKEPGLMAKILSPIKKIMSKVKKMMSFSSRKKDSEEDAKIGVEDDAPENA